MRKRKTIKKKQKKTKRKHTSTAEFKYTRLKKIYITETIPLSEQKEMNTVFFFWRD